MLKVEFRETSSGVSRVPIALILWAMEETRGDLRMEMLTVRSTLIKTAKEHIHSPVSTCLSHGPQVLTDLEKKRKIEFRNCWEIWSCYRKKVVMKLLEIWYK